MDISYVSSLPPKACQAVIVQLKNKIFSDEIKKREEMLQPSLLQLINKYCQFINSNQI